MRDWGVWNEENLCGEPTCHDPERAARFYNAARRACPGCRIVAADLLDVPGVGAWARRFARVAKGRLIWGLHNYIDANRFTTRGTRELLEGHPRPGLVHGDRRRGPARRTGTRSRSPRAWRTPGKATAWVFKLAALSPRVQRIYFYQWAPAPDPKASWDSALTDRKGRPRPALAILQSWLLRHAPASSS